MQLFYTPDIKGSNYTLDEQESKHCIRVLRMHEGDIIHLTDGKGSLYQAKITKASPKACNLEIVEQIPEYEKRNFLLHIAIAPTKNIDRFEWFLEKATEIGIDEITPVITEQSERRQINHERLERIVISAMKQSIKAYKPKINELCSYKHFIDKDFSVAGCYIAHCNETEKTELKNLYHSKTNAVILIGPEGDFTKIEVQTATDRGFKPVSLGNSRLRTETAGVVACHTINLLND